MKLKKTLGKWARHAAMVITDPKRFFSKIVADGNLEESMLKAFLYGFLGGGLVLVLRLCGGATITFGSVFSGLVIVPVLAVALLFVMGGLLMLVSEITGGERDWEIAIKGLASVFFIYPVVLVLNSLAFNCTSLWIASILVDAYILFLLYNIAVYCMKGRRVSVMVAMAVFVIFLFTVYMTDYRMGWFMLKNTGTALACLM
jgi:hypothetical protein